MVTMIENIMVVKGKGDGYMDCYTCGVRMTIVECARNRYEGKVWGDKKAFRVVMWCDKCVPVGLHDE
tara:strand:+ start:467 stop:667 length:201 start_codon:yes stop_codon:yes gene_type:complete